MPAHRPRARRAAAQGAGRLSTAAGSGARTLARSTVLSAVGEGSNVLLFLLGFLAAAWLGPHAFGVYSTAAAFVSLFRVLPEFGMSYASSLTISRDRTLAAATAAPLLGFQALLSAVTLVLCLVLGTALYDDVTELAVVILSFDLILKSVKSTLRWLLKSLHRFDVEAVSLVAERIALVVLGVFALRRGAGVAGFVGVFLLVRVVDTAALWAFVRARVVPLQLVADRAAWWDLWRRGLPFAYAGVMITLLFDVDVVLLERLRGATEVGWYRAPVSILAGMTMIPRILTYAFIPTMAALHVTEPARVTELYARGSRYLLAVALPIAVFGILESDRLIPLLFGPSYASSIPAARILIPAGIFMFLSNYGETTLACIDRWRAIVVTSTLALVLNVALNLAWIPRHGYIGSAWATLAAEGVYFASTLVALGAAGHAARWSGIVVRSVVPALAFAGVLWLARPLPMLAAAALASVTWIGVAWLVLLDDKERGLVKRR